MEFIDFTKQMITKIKLRSNLNKHRDEGVKLMLRGIKFSISKKNLEDTEVLLKAVLPIIAVGLTVWTHFENNRRHV